MTTRADITSPAELLSVSTEKTLRQPKRPARRIGEKSRRGFAAMSPEQQRRIASEGGRASHRNGNGHRFTSEEAREAGRIGGKISRRGPQKSKSKKK